MWANALDSLEQRLIEQALPQEKIYIHTDNNCYFAGDTLWYKAYVLRSDNLRPSPLSKILYVELLSPDGYLIQRERIIIDHQTQSAGQFFIPDTIYSGYYELRAYTRWQLNFNVSEKAHSRFNDEWFFNKQLARDYFRDFPGLYSRVFPIYERPQETGDFATRRINSRPKRRLEKETTDLTMKFYPEGGHLITNLPGRVAFEIQNYQGQPLDIKGKLSDGTEFQTIADGRGIITLSNTPSHRLKATFQYGGKEHSFDLPSPLQIGATITHDAELGQSKVLTQGIEAAAVSVTCRGRLVTFRRTTEPIEDESLPTGVNEIIAYDAQARPLAVRQIFVNHNDMGNAVTPTLSIKQGENTIESISAAPYQQVKLTANLSQPNLNTVSVAVRDQRSDFLSFDDGNILTDLLLAGDLRGFVAHPNYYFEKDDAEHRRRLDMLLMIQGWSKYAPVDQIRYQPERAFGITGQIHKLNVTDRNEFDLMDFLNATEATTSGDYTNPCFSIDASSIITLLKENTTLPTPQGLIGNEGDESYTSNSEGSNSESGASEDVNNHADPIQNELTDHNRNRLKHPTLVEAELVKGQDIAGVAVQADSIGHYAITLPPFYDQGIMFMTAYEQRDSVKYCLASTTDKEKAKPFACPEFYLRQDYFYPVFSEPYSWFQTHAPEEIDEMEEELALDTLRYNHILDNVTVNTRRIRKLHKFDKTKPAMVVDFNQLLNETIDRGLNYGGFNSITFWEKAARTLFGNMGNPGRRFSISASVDGHIFVKTYQIPQGEGVGTFMTPTTLKRKTDPSRIWKVRIFTDYSIRDGRGREENRSVPDVTFELIPVPNDGTRATRRDRRFVIDGFTYPEEFYSPDYTQAVPEKTNDYRRTLYWNPNAQLDQDGNLNIQFFNGSRSTRFCVSVCGVSNAGKIVY